MEKYIIDLEYAKKLKELGVKQESEFYNCVSYSNVSTIMDKTEVIKYSEIKHSYSAFTTDELMEMLPYKIRGFAKEVKVDIFTNKSSWRKFKVKGKLKTTKLIDMYEVKYGRIDYIYFIDQKLSNALAKMYIWLIENNYVEVK